METTLYLMVGYPGAGKTTTAQLIHEITGAEFLWTAKYRREWFGNPTFQPDETSILYERLNDMTEYLLKKGKSVIYDTSFNYYKDREMLREVAKNCGAKTVLIWVQAPLEIAQARAVEHPEQHRKTRILGGMSPEKFERLTNQFDPPHKDEPCIIIDGTKVTKQYVQKQLEQFESQKT